MRLCASSRFAAAILWSGLIAALFSPGAMGAELVAETGSGQILERTITPGPSDRFTHVDFTCWLPEPGRPVRAVIIHQHGCGNSTAEANPPIARDFHWQALARKHDCALLVPHYTVAGECADWNDPDSGSERALFSALADFAQRAARPELVSARWILWGHSGGSSWSVQMMTRHPDRVLAASLRGGCHKQFGEADFRRRFAAVAKEVPLLFVWGQRETTPASSHYVSWQPMQTMYRELRAAGGHVALALDPRAEHECGDSRLLVIPYFDAVLTARAGGVKPAGVWVETTTRETVQTTPSQMADPALAWLPSAAVARQWKEFCEHGKIRPARTPAMTPRLVAEWDLAARAVRLRWWIVPELDGGVRVVRIFRDGQPWKMNGRSDAKYLATSRDSPPYGLHISTLSDADVAPGAAHDYTLSFVDATGGESPMSNSIRIRVPH